MLYLLLLLACASDCEPGDCDTGQVCAWDGEYVCVTPCSEDDPCPEPLECTGTASSCPACQDILTYCE